MSNCNKISELLSAYLDGEITDKEKELVETHLLSCTSCKQKLEIMQKTKDILKDAPPIPVPETLLKDFEEYRKKSEQTEKKVVPLYKNYRVYASIAAVFVFAFVLKSGLWQQDKFVPDTLTQSTEQSISAPAVVENKAADSNEASQAEVKPEATNEKKSESQPAGNQPAQNQADAPKERVIKSKPANPDADNSTDVASTLQAEPVQESAVVHEASAPEGEVIAAYDESQQPALMSARTVDPPQTDAAEEAKAPVHAIVYVSDEHLAKAAKLLSEGEYFYAQVEQKLSDNRIPFESNFLSLDESIPHKVVVMVKE